MERTTISAGAGVGEFCEYKQEVAPLEYLNKDNPLKISGIDQKDIQTALDVADQFVSGTKHVTRGGATYSMLRSFRFKGSYSMLSGLVRLTPVKNVSGNLRGMVISAKGRSAFNSLRSSTRFLANVGLGISFVQELAAEQPYIETLINTEEPLADKISKICAVTSSAITRTAGGLVFTGAHIPTFVVDGIFGEENSSTKQKLLRWENEYRLITSPENFNEMFLHLTSEISAYRMED